MILTTEQAAKIIIELMQMNGLPKEAPGSHGILFAGG
jgi:hypothetical protein